MPSLSLTRAGHGAIVERTPDALHEADLSPFPPPPPGPCVATVFFLCDPSRSMLVYLLHVNFLECATKLRGRIRSKPRVSVSIQLGNFGTCIPSVEVPWYPESVLGARAFPTIAMLVGRGRLE